MKRGLILLIFLSTHVNAFPQSLRMYGGLNLTKYGSSFISTATTFSQKSGISGGIAFAYPLSEKLHVEAGLIYSQKSSGVSLSYPDGQEFTGMYRYSAIALPLMIKIDLLAEATPYLLFGPEIDLIFSHKLNVTDTQEVFDLKETTNHIGFGINAGIGYEIPIHSFALFFESRYTIGLSNLLSSNPDSEIVRNTSLQLLIGGRINLK